jgi:hypothetical protein
MRSNWASWGWIEGGLSLDFNISKGVIDRWSDVLFGANRCVVRRLLVCCRSVYYFSDSASIGQRFWEVMLLDSGFGIGLWRGGGADLGGFVFGRGICVMSHL